MKLTIGQLRRIIAEALKEPEHRLHEFSIGDFFHHHGDSKSSAAAKLKLVDLFADGADVPYERAEPLIRALEDAGDYDAARFYHEKLKKHHKDSMGNLRSKDNKHFTDRMSQIYGNKKREP